MQIFKYFFLIFMSTTFLPAQTLHMAQDPHGQIPPLHVEIPIISAFEKTYLRFSTSFIEINFGRPNVKNREIFGGIGPYDHVWRTGADWSSEIAFGENVKINGILVPKGKYSLQSIPHSDKPWQVFLTKETWSWEQYGTTAPADAIVFNINPTITQDTEETLNMYFSQVIVDKQAVLNMRWDKMHWQLTIKQENELVAMQKIDEIMKKATKEEEKPYWAAAQYYYSNNLDLNKALTWSTAEVSRQMKAENPYWWTFLLQGRILKALSRFAEAKKNFELAIQYAGNKTFYIETILKKELLEVEKLQSPSKKGKKDK